MGVQIDDAQAIKQTDSASISSSEANIDQQDNYMGSWADQVEAADHEATKHQQSPTQNSTVQVRQYDVVVVPEALIHQ